MSKNNRQPDRSVWLAIILIVAVLVASGAATLVHLFGAGEIDTLAVVGAAFVGTVTLCVTIWNFLVPR